MTDNKTCKDIENIDLNYNKLLDRLYLSLPPKTLTDSRFEKPMPICIIQGKKTIWKNFEKTAKDLKRDPKLLYKFFMKEVSTSSNIDNQTLILNGVFTNIKINQILDKFIKIFVLCSECNKPDTELITQNNVKILRCTACGAKKAVPKL